MDERVLRTWTTRIALWLLPCAALCTGWTYRPADGGTASWEAQGTSPAPGEQADGIVLPLDFSAEETDRNFWDLPIQADLGKAASIDVDLTVDQPDLLRSLMVYLRSGAGWYLAGSRHLDAGRQTLSFSKGSFSAEGQPGSWTSIDRLRLSAWKGTSGSGRMVLHGIASHSSSLVLVQGTSSAPKGPERTFAARTADRVSRWLSELHLPHQVITDEQVEQGSLQDASLVILSYNPQPSKAFLRETADFVRRGGKMLVFYSSSPALAEQLGFRLGEYQKAETPGRWEGFRFTDPDRFMVPPFVEQQSLNIRPIYPHDQDAEVIAYWNSSGGDNTGPAWCWSPRGAWMSHILLEGDTRHKQDMLMGLLAGYDPGLWRPVAARVLREAGRIASYTTLTESRSGISRTAAQSGRSARIAPLLKSSLTLSDLMQRQYSSGRYPETVQTAGKLTRTLTEAFALAQPQVLPEMRGVWEHDGTGWFPGDWNRTCSLLAENGINAVFANMLWGGLAHYPSSVLPRSTTFRRYGDQLEQGLAAARKNGLDFHLWMVCWNLQGAPDDFVARMKREARVQVDAAGKTMNWLCPSHPDNQALAINALAEAVKRYPQLTGIHLDYIRYPEKESCFCATSRKKFEAWLGKPVEGWPSSVRQGGALEGPFKNFKRDQITLFLRGVSRQVRPLKPGLQLSAAVFAGYPGCVERVGQDWAAWLREGLLDFAVPMSYTPSASSFKAMTRGHLELDPSFQGKIIPGIGVSSNESEHQAPQTIEQIAVTRELQTGGFVLFDLSRHLKDEVLPFLGMGPLAAPAAGN